VTEDGGGVAADEGQHGAFGLDGRLALEQLAQVVGAVARGIAGAA
jgi:hypothetical protein